MGDYAWQPNFDSNIKLILRAKTSYKVKNYSLMNSLEFSLSTNKLISGDVLLHETALAHMKDQNNLGYCILLDCIMAPTPSVIYKL